MDLHERVAGLSPEKRALLLERLRDASTAEPSVPSIRRRDGDASSYPLSFAQERLWFLEQLEPGTAAYNMPAAVRLSGRLDVGALRWSLEQIQDWQEPLRTRFATVEGEPVQVIAEAPLSTLEEVDLGHLPEAAREAESVRWVDEAARRPFDLTAGPLLRTSLLKLDEAEHVLLVVMHHVISDAWSVGLFFRELARLYEGHVAGAAPTLPELPIQYVDYVHWQRERLQGGLLAEQLDYWKRQLDGAPDALELPTDRPRPPVQTFEGATQARMLSRELSASLRELSEREGVTLFMTLLAAFQTLLMRYSGQEDVVVGSPIAGRTRPELEELIGFFVNTLVFRTDLAGDPGFRALLRRVRATCLEAYGHQEVPFERLVAELQPERVRSRPPLCQVLLVLQNVPMPDVELPGLTMSPFPVASGTSKFDLTLFAVEIEDRLALSLEHNTHLFDESTARRLLGHYERLLEGVASDPEAGVWTLPLLTGGERARVVEEWSGRRTPYPRDSTIPEQFELEVARAPGAEAVVCGPVRWSYGELNERANRLAHHLKALGVGPESRVGLCVARSPELVVGLLGILKAGGAYVPLDPEYPAERLAYMATDAGLEVLLTTEGERDRLPALAGVRVVSLDGEWESIAESGSGENPACETGPESLAYVMYTSGSTGKPKGTLVEQRGVVRLVKGTDYVELGPEETLLQFSTISFDASTFEIWGALLNGGRLVVYPDRRPTLEGLAEVIQGEGVTTLWLTAGLFHEMVERHLEGLRGVRQLLAGGDVLSVEHVRRAVAELDGCRVINGYGPTENTTFTCCHAVTDAVGLEGSVPIGRPIANTEVYLLDRRLEPVPVGVPGRLYTGGDGLARAYLNDAELTAARFVAHPFRAGERLYDTGDRARWRPDGTIEFLGRDDQQVKIRGYRVEPGEVETAVAEHPRVRQVVVAARGEGAGEKRLVAYVVPSAGDPLTIGELREQVRGKLPDYMIPQALVCLEALPLTANGKVDRAALPEPEAGRGALGTEYAAPRTELERTIAEIWQEVLEIERVGLHDNFFDLGGHSLLALRLFSMIEKRLGARLPLDVLFEAPTVAHLAESIGGDEPSAPSSLIAIQPKGTKPPLFLVPPSASPGLVFARLARALGEDQPLYGLTPPPLNGTEDCRRWFEVTAALYLDQIRSVQPQGPYYLGGRCYGGIVAYEMAQQLVRRGEEVGALVLMDVGLPLTRGLRFQVGRAKVHLRMGRVNRKRRRAKGLPPLEYAVIPYHGVRFDLVPAHRRHKADQDKLVWDANLRAAARYVTRPYRGRITLLQSQDHDSERVRTMWAALAGGGLTYEVIRGRHKEMLHEPLVQSTAERLSRLLAEAGAPFAAPGSSGP